IVRIENNQGVAFPLPDTDFLALRANHPAFEHVAVFANTSFNLTGAGTPEIVRGAWVSGDFFTTLGAQPLVGRFLQEPDAVPGAADAVVLSHAFWTRQFGADRGIIGRAIRLNDVPSTIVGVARPGLSFPGPNIDLWRNLGIATPPRRGPFYLTGLVRLQPHT